MQKIEAVVRLEKRDEISQALEKLGLPGMMVTQIEGYGQQKGVVEQFRGREFKVNFIPKVRIEIVVKDEDVDKIVNEIIKISRTGEIGDGKIFIYDIKDVIRIRTGEKGEKAI